MERLNLSPENNLAANKGADPLKELRVVLLLIKINLLQSWRKIKTLKNQSILLTTVTGLFLAGYIIFSFLLFYKGLSFVGKFPGFGMLLIERLLFLMFAILFVLLLFSNLIISYTNLFKNRESIFLLHQPVRFQTIFVWKFIESTVLASWAFLFLIAPFLVAYGLNKHVPWYYYPYIVVMIGFFIILPATLGAWLAILVARYIENKFFQILSLVIGISILCGLYFWLKPDPLPQDESRVLAVIDRLLAKTRFVEEYYLPSYWLSSGILNISEGSYIAASLYTMVLFTYALFFCAITFTKTGKLFYDSASSVQSRSNIFANWSFFKKSLKKKATIDSSPTLMERFFRLLWWLPPPARAILIKDIRLFLRDTTQWAQTLILFGLLTVYIINLRHFTHQLTNPFWIHLVSYLNLMACALNLATLTTRFIYPQFSLEGKRLWIIGMGPISLKKIIITKFWFAFIACLTITLGLIILSCRILKMPLDRTLFFAISVTIMTFTLNGMAIGLGVLYPNFKEDNPSKIVSSFGGTFCLILSFLYIVSSVALLAIGSPWSKMGVSSPIIPLVCWTLFSLMSVGFGVVPLRLSLERAKDIEI